ncbi:hypothetical protein OHV05_35450 (plasmid) [Kitasatospora sp. NBC_00070]|uniref:hypothetical protein n=1 Tax=Kitasatospora sp. NBC_00070 TaxID=2975962 RepID=UPI002F90984F
MLAEARAAAARSATGRAAAEAEQARQKERERKRQAAADKMAAEAERAQRNHLAREEKRAVEAALAASRAPAAEVKASAGPGTEDAGQWRTACLGATKVETSGEFKRITTLIGWPPKNARQHPSHTYPGLLQSNAANPPLTR